MKQMDAVSVVGCGCQCESYVALRRPRWWHCPMLTMRADSCPARLKPPTPASSCSSRAARLIATLGRPDALPRFWRATRSLNGTRRHTEWEKGPCAVDLAETC